MLIQLCHRDDIPEGGARGFELGGCQLFGLRQHGQIRLYLNRCPHLGLPLNWEPDGFLDPEGALVRCANHGALFDPRTGECLSGPCRGDQLWQIDHLEQDGRILVSDEELPL